MYKENPFKLDVLLHPSINKLFHHHLIFFGVEVNSPEKSLIYLKLKASQIFGSLKKVCQMKSVACMNVPGLEKKIETYFPLALM